VLKVLPEEERVLALEGAEVDGHNKWQNGFVGGVGCVYGIPCNAPGALCINPASDHCSIMGALYHGLNKWQGGVVGLDGSMYCIPLAAKSVMRIVPSVYSLATPLKTL
jgi:hypothetical protein